jgi:hypothetical protein
MYIEALILMQILAINSNNVNVINVNVILISLRRYYIKSCNRNTHGRGKPSVARQDKWNCDAGAWLSVFPNRSNGTCLSADEWRDNARLRYNHFPLDMPATCNGCRAKMSVEHALLYKMGGLVHIQYDNVVCRVKVLHLETRYPLRNLC